jgi:hypothetical protein
MISCGIEAEKSRESGDQLEKLKPCVEHYNAWQKATREFFSIIHNGHDL